jgi:hypothetical protein
MTALMLAALPAVAQYPGQLAKPDQGTPQLRAVAVLEWTGDEQHPKASRLVPVSVFDGQQLQDGGVYMAQPEPLALEGEVEYQLKQNGKNVGLYVIKNAAMEQGSWVGYGNWKSMPSPKPAQAAQTWSDDEDVTGDRPVLHRKAHDDDPSGGGNGAGAASKGPPPDPDRPTLHRPDANSGASSDTSSGSSDSGKASSSGSGPAPDPDRPTLHRDSTDSSAGSAPSVGNTSEADPDRPKLTKKSDDEGTVSSLPDVSDPNRPRLIRGKSSDSGPAAMPSLIGLPPDMEQAVAVSDSKSAPEHVWSFSWANPADEAKYKGQLEDMARAALGLTQPPAPARPATTKTTATHRTASGKTASGKTASGKTASGKTRLSLPPPPPALLDERFRVFELAYGSGATMVLSAHTDGAGAQQKFVTLVAQPDLYGSIVVLVKSLTDGAHLDATPRMKLVDAVDAMADNRGELLFEMRGATQRQFALYRVLRGRATRVFVTGGDSFAAASNE